MDKVALALIQTGGLLATRIAYSLETGSLVLSASLKDAVETL